MDISGLSVSYTSGTINTGLEIAMLSKALDTAESAAQVLTEMMGQAGISPGLGEHIDIRA